MDRRSYRPRSPSASQPATNPRVSAPSFLGSPQDEIPRFVPSISVNDVTDEPPREPADGILHPDEEMTLADECPAQDTLSDTRSITASQYDAIIHEELEKTWILNLSMHFRDRSKREKFFVTYRERDHLWRRVTISLDYRDAPPNSLEMDLINTHYQREKSAKIYEAIRESLRDIQFYDTVTNLKLQTTDGRLHVHVVEDGNVGIYDRLTKTKLMIYRKLYNIPLLPKSSIWVAAAFEKETSLLNPTCQDLFIKSMSTVTRSSKRRFQVLIP
jgi:hypothetical protein